MNTGLLINNEWRAALGESFVSTNPVDQHVVFEGNAASTACVDAAVLAARAAFPEWAALSVDERFEYVEQFKVQLEKNTDLFTQLIAQETGKPLWESKTEVSAMIGKVAISKTAYDERTGVRENEKAGAVFATRHKPHGVLAVFGPYNFPGHLPNGHIIPALIAGNTLVFKPSELTPAVGALMMQCWLDAGLPAGVLNLVQGGRDTGIALTGHQQVDGLLFTGSFATGEKLHQACAGHTGKVLALEMGGNNPLVVTETAQIDAAVYNIIQSAFITAGQRCTCARRLILLPDVADQIIPLLVEKAKQIQVGHFADEPAPFMGAVISNAAAQAVLDAQNAWVADGGELLLEAKRLKADTALVSPGIVDVTALATRSDKEIFGPLLQVIRVENFDEAIAEANNTEYGLAAGLLSDNPERYKAFYQAARAGIVNWNKPTTGAASTAPFGGIGKSGNHRPSAYYAADYCAYPVASVETEALNMPEAISPGLSF